jgi:SAM-dependent methyltransferase
MKKFSQKTGFSTWYDGFLYHAILAPFAGGLWQSIADLIGDKSKVLDVGCGDGSLSFKLSRKCRHVTGIDLSKRMIDFASLQKKRRHILNVEFVQGNAARLPEILTERFDYAAAVMSLHEMDPASRHQVIAGCLKLADRLILADYAVPFPRNILGAAQTLMEVMAGKRHYEGFKDWQGKGGLDGFLEREGLKVHERLPWKDRIGLTVIVKRK